MSKPPQTTHSKDDARATLAIATAVVVGFALLLLLIWAAHRGELNHAETAQSLAESTQVGSDIAITVQRITLLQYGLVSRHPGELSTKIDDELRKELAALELKLRKLGPVTGRSPLSPDTRAVALRLGELGEQFHDTSGRILASLPEREHTRPLVESFAQLSTDIVAASRDFRELLSRDDIAFAVRDERSRSAVFAATMALTFGIGVLILAFVAVRVRREFALRRAAEQKLVTANRELEQFAAIVAHDLNGPLHNLSLGAQVIERTIRETKPAILEVTTMMKRETKRLHEMVEALLRLARLSHSRVEPRQIPLDTLLRDVTNGLKKKIEDAGATIRHEGHGLLWGDPALLNNLFQNLIENSIKYSRPETPPVIVISHTREGSSSIVRYDDNGQGIPAEARGHVFEPFYQCATGDTKAGLGLGLSVVQKIIRAHGGEIAIVDKPTEGTCFVMKLPATDRPDGRTSRHAQTVEQPDVEQPPSSFSAPLRQSPLSRSSR